MPRESRAPSTTRGLLPHFTGVRGTITGAFANDDGEINVWDDAWNHNHDECERCHNENGDDHPRQDCPYGGCDDGEHCPWECPYETGHTDWDKIYSHLGEAMHRGMALRIPGLDRHAAPHEIVHHVMGEIQHGGGTHWTDYHDQARHYTHAMVRDGDNLHVVLHAKRPERDDIETDPHELLDQDVIGYTNHADREIPIQRGAHVHLTGISWKHRGAAEWHRHDFDQPMQHRAVRRTAGPAERVRFTPGPGESTSWGPGHDRITHGLSLGELHIDDAEQIGYRADSRQHPDPTDLRSGWQTLPRQLYHATTNLTEARHGLKTRDELGMRHGTGLGGGPDDTISLTDSREHAHRMLDALHDYHAVLTGKTPLDELDRRARAGEGASRPYADHAAGQWPPHELDSMKRGMRHVQDFQAVEDARAAGLHPHPQTHKNLGPGLDGREYGVGWERPATPEELSYDRSEYYHSHMNARHFAGGERPVLFMGNHAHGLAQRDPSDFAVLRVAPHPKAQGWRVPGEHEWRTGTGDALHVEGVDPTPGHTAAKTWLPHDRFFGPGKPDLDPRLFDGEHLKSAWREALLGLVNRAFADYTYGVPGSWQHWARAYLAGSQASHWYGNDDLDVLIGVDYDRFRRAQPRHRNLGDREIDEMLNAAAHELCDPARFFGIDGQCLGPFDSTLYVNGGAYDIRAIKPYAAYDVGLDRWAVRPVEVPDDFGPDKLPSADFLYARSLADQVKALKKLPADQAGSLGAALYDQLHAQRHGAFTDGGTGLYDVRNIAWKYLDQHPDKPMEQLVTWKREAEHPLTILAAFERPALPNPASGHESNARAGHDDWFHGTRAAFDHPEVNERDERDNAGHRHWNTALGTHWTGRHDIASTIASDNTTAPEDSDEGDDWDGEDEDTEPATPRVFHARLHIRNPKRYDSEFDMDREVYGHEYDADNQPSHHDEFHLEDWEDDPYLGHEDDLRQAPDMIRGYGDTRRRFSDWISHHPDRHGIAMRFKQRLTDAGHDGVVYGNEYEKARHSGHGHASAIAFHPRQVEVTQIHHAEHSCLGGGELENFRHPRPGQPALPGMGPGLEHLAAKDGTSDAEFGKSSMMIALVPPRTLAEKMVEKDGEPAHDMHVTLAYLPHVDSGATGRIAGVVAEWASRHRAPECRVQGAGTFVAAPGKAHVLWAAVDIKGSSHLHSTLVDALESAGFAPAKDHGFCAHLTLAYKKHHVRFLPKITPESFTAHTVWVCRGGDWRPVPFGGATAQV